MDDEFPKTLNSAVSVAGKVHGSIKELSDLLATLDADLGALSTSMNAALGAMKAGPTPPAPVAAVKPVVVEKPVEKPVNFPHS